MYFCASPRRARILELVGVKLSDFATHEEAFTCAEAAIKQNAVDFKFEVTKIDNPIPMLVRFKYFIGHGTKRSWSSTDTTSVAGTFEPKTKKAMEDFGAAARCLGGDSGGGSGGQAKVKVESPLHEELKVVTAGLRQSRLYLKRPYKT